MKAISVIIFLVVGNLFPDDLHAQPEMNHFSPERVTFFCDRNLYVTGETIFFHAGISTETDDNTTCYSRILYVELISPDGTAFARGKYKITGTSASGSIPLPKDLLSGNYYLKSYTHFDRNFGPGIYCYTPVRIVNPYLKKVIEGNFGNGKVAALIPEAANPAIQVSTDKQEYGVRDSIHISYRMSDDVNTPTSVCLSVVPRVTYSMSHPLVAPDMEEEGRNFFHERRGVSLTGRLLDEIAGNPLSTRRINLSVPAEKDFIAVETDSSGRFYFLLPFFSGNRDIFLSTEKSGDEKPEILVDNDFTPLIPDLPSPLFRLDSAESRVSLQMAANLELKNIFFPEDSSSGGGSPKGSDSFYGKPSYILNIGDYVELPVLEDYFTNFHYRPGSEK